MPPIQRRHSNPGKPTYSTKHRPHRRKRKPPLLLLLLLLQLRSAMSPQRASARANVPQPLAARSNRAVQSPAGPCTMRVDEGIGIARPLAASASGLGGGRRARSRATTRERGRASRAGASAVSTYARTVRFLKRRCDARRQVLGAFRTGGTHQSKPEITESRTTNPLPLYIHTHIRIQSNPIQPNPIHSSSSQQPANHKHVYLPSSYHTPLCLSRSPPTPRGTQRCSQRALPCVRPHRCCCCYWTPANQTAGRQTDRQQRAIGHVMRCDASVRRWLDAGGESKVVEKAVSTRWLKSGFALYRVAEADTITERKTRKHSPPKNASLCD